MAKVKIIVHKVTIVSRSVEIDTTCPNCQADLTESSSIEEGRLCSTVASTHFTVREDERDALSETDSCDDDVDYRATVFVNCGNCGHHLIEE